VWTGLTRNGVWLVEGGQVVAPVSTLRFTQSYLEALAPGAVTVGSVVDPQPGHRLTPGTFSGSSPGTFSGSSSGRGVTRRRSGR
jgi:hypothetical protein